MELYPWPAKERLQFPLVQDVCLLIGLPYLIRSYNV